MHLKIDQQMAKAIDTLTRRHAQTTASRGELKQLSTLFGQPYLCELQRLLQGSLTQHRVANYDVTIRLAWIDKIPLADIATEPERTELGDAVLFAFDELIIPNGKGPSITNARAVLLQAKVTEKHSQIATPKVPVSEMKRSTKKEFDLLSVWPVFDLYKASNSNKPLAKQIDLRGTQCGPLPYGWYIAAPRLRSSAKGLNTSHWPSWWMAGPPILNHGCNLTFGGFLQAFFAGSRAPSSGTLEVGASFHCKSYPPSPTGLTGWDRICAEIIKIVENSNAPQSVFGPIPTSRMTAMGSISLPIPRSALHARPRASLAYSIDAGPHPTCIPASESGLGRLARRLFDWTRGRKRIPVLIIHTLLTESIEV